MKMIEILFEHVKRREGNPAPLGDWHERIAEDSLLAERDWMAAGAKLASAAACCRVREGNAKLTGVARKPLPRAVCQGEPREEVGALKFLVFEDYAPDRMDTLDLVLQKQSDPACPEDDGQLTQGDEEVPQK